MIIKKINDSIEIIKNIIIELNCVRRLRYLRFLDKLQRKYGRYAIRGLMKYIVAITAGVFFISYILPSSNIKDNLVLYPPLVLSGQVWRLITFIFIPEGNSLWIIISLYFYYLIGNSLESEWGSFKFNIYYLVGILGTILATFITGGLGVPTYLNMSLFFAFAYIYPNFEVLIFFILPVKMKYLGILSGVFLAISFITGSFTTKLAIIAALLNFILFFGKDIYTSLMYKSKKTHKKYKNNVIEMKRTIHRCTICGKTEKTDPYMDFRYCSKCDGEHEYCMDHLNNHEHIKN